MNKGYKDKDSTNKTLKDHKETDSRGHTVPSVVSTGRYRWEPVPGPRI